MIHVIRSLSVLVVTGCFFFAETESSIEATSFLIASSFPLLASERASIGLKRKERREKEDDKKPPPPFLSFSRHGLRVNGPFMCLAGRGLRCQDRDNLPHGRRARVVLLPQRIPDLPRRPPSFLCFHWTKSGVSIANRYENGMGSGFGELGESGSTAP